ncbi:MAG: hypothetical protein EOO38_22805, partial [Cytophagaceae bacterium]
MMNRNCRTLSSLLLGLGLAIISIASQGAQATTLYVAPAGNDQWSGASERPNAARTNGPLASLQGARDAIRKLKAKGPLKEPVRVMVTQGNYPVSKPLILEPQDSGTAHSPISYEAAPNAHPIINGGRNIGGWKRGANGIWSTQIPTVKSGKWYFEQLWVNGKRA